MGWAWVFTIAASATLAALAELLVKAGAVEVWVALLAWGAVGLGLLVGGMRREERNIDFGIGSVDGADAVGVGGGSARGQEIRVGKSR